MRYEGRRKQLQKQCKTHILLHQNKQKKCSKNAHGCNSCHPSPACNLVLLLPPLPEASPVPPPALERGSKTKTPKVAAGLGRSWASRQLGGWWMGRLAGGLLCPLFWPPRTYEQAHSSRCTPSSLSKGIGKPYSKVATLQQNKQNRSYTVTVMHCKAIGLNLSLLKQSVSKYYYSCIYAFPVNPSFFSVSWKLDYKNFRAGSCLFLLSFSKHATRQFMPKWTELVWHSG